MKSPSSAHLLVESIQIIAALGFGIALDAITQAPVDAQAVALHVVPAVAR
jgi:hypothetical protein